MAQTRRRPGTANPRASTKQTGQVIGSVAAGRKSAVCPRVGCVPEHRCAVHRDSEPELFSDLAAEFIAQLGRPRLRLIKGGRRW